MSNRDTHLAKQRKYPQFVTLFCQIFKSGVHIEVTAFCQIMTEKCQVVTAFYYTNVVATYKF